MPFRSSVSRKLCACRAKQKRRAFPHPLVGVIERLTRRLTLADRQRTAPSGRQGGQSATLAPLCSVTHRLDRFMPVPPQGDPSRAIAITVRRKPSPPDTGAPKVYGRTDGDCCTPRFVTACFLPPGLKPSGCVNGNRGNSTWMFSCPSGSRMAVASFVPSVQNHSRRVCPHPFCNPCPPAAPLNMGQRTPHVCACAYAYVRVRKTCLLCRYSYSYSSLGNAFITHERYDSVIESLSCSQRGMVLINGFGQRMGKQRSARSCGTSIL
jgi:hypothetical protein